jgi:two-component system chemotaxis response regulator CheY
MNSESAQLISEQIDSIEARLLAMESGTGESIDPKAAVHLLFRDFHNLKSSLSMSGSDISARLIHQAESCLDALRSGKGDSGSDWVDLLLEVVDQVRKFMGAGMDGEAPALSAKLDGLLAQWAHKEKEEAREIGFPLDEAEAKELQKAVSSGLSLFILEKLVGEGLDAASVDALPVFETLAEIGSAIARRLVRVKGSGAVLTVVFASAKTRDELSFAVFDPFYPVIKTLPPQVQKLKRILIVDDDPVAVMLLQFYLIWYGRIDTAQTGSEALGKFTGAYDAKDPYDVVFLDIMLPGIPGISVLEAMRKHEHEAGIPINMGTKVVMASSLGDYSSISSAFNNQCEMYLVKPIDSQAIDKTMSKLGIPKTSFPHTAVPKSG